MAEITLEDVYYIQNNPERVFAYLKSLSGGGSGPTTVAWADVTGKPTTFPPATHTHNASDINAGTLNEARIPALAISKITNLQTTLDGKLTASKVAARPASTATDVAGVVADLNAVIAAMKTSGVMSST
ncbi:hypothetical protein D1872_144200 [compost metagenome]